MVWRSDQRVGCCQLSGWPETSGNLAKTGRYRSEDVSTVVSVSAIMILSTQRLPARPTSRLGAAMVVVFVSGVMVQLCGDAFINLPSRLPKTSIIQRRPVGVCSYCRYDHDEIVNGSCPCR